MLDQMLHMPGLGFNPKSLFRTGDQGVFYDTSDFSTMFQDRNGVTPCTAAGQTVGMRLDKRLGALGNLGPELMPKTSSWVSGDWTMDPAFSVAAGNLVVDNNAQATQGFARPSTSILTADKWYEIRATVANVVTLGQCSFRLLPISGSTGAVTGPNLVAGENIWRVQNTGSLVRPGFRVPSNASVTNLSITNVTVKEIPGNHWAANSDAARPLLGRIPFSGRRNLQSYSEAVGSWLGSIRTTTTSNATTDVNGELTADRVFVNSTNASGGVAQPYATAHTGNCTWSIDFKYSNSQWVMLRIGVHRAWFDILNGVLGATSGTVASRTIVPLVNGWFRCTITADPASSTVWYLYPATDANSTDAGTLNQGSFVARSQVELGSTETPYQKVVTSADVTEAGQRDCWHLLHDGTDDGGVTNTIDFTATDEMTVCVGLRKLSDASIGCVAETSTLMSTNDGCVLLLAPQTTATADASFASKGTSQATSIGEGIAAPITTVMTGISKISTPVATLRSNGVQVSTTSASQGTGNYISHPLYTGRRGNATAPFNGREFAMLVINRLLTANELASLERWMGQRAGVTI